jgi:hypothetical protein
VGLDRPKPILQLKSMFSCEHFSTLTRFQGLPPVTGQWEPEKNFVVDSKRYASIIVGRSHNRHFFTVKVVILISHM